MTAERLTAVARLAATLIAGIATAAGLALDANTVYTVVAAVITVACFVWSWWKNNNLTQAAQAAQQVLEQLKDDENAADGTTYTENVQAVIDELEANGVDDTTDAAGASDAD